MSAIPKNIHRFHDEYSETAFQLLLISNIAADMKVYLTEYK